MHASSVSVRVPGIEDQWKVTLFVFGELLIVWVVEKFLLLIWMVESTIQNTSYQLTQTRLGPGGNKTRFQMGESSPGKPSGFINSRINNSPGHHELNFVGNGWFRKYSAKERTQDALKNSLQSFKIPGKTPIWTCLQPLTGHISHPVLNKKSIINFKCFASFGGNLVWFFCFFRFWVILWKFLREFSCKYSQFLWFLHYWSSRTFWRCPVAFSRIFGSAFAPVLFACFSFFASVYSSNAQIQT